MEIKLTNLIKFGKPREAFARSTIKSITWRVIGTLSLVLVAYSFTGKINLSLALGAIDIVSNIILYIIHERIWERIEWGRSFWDSITFSDNKLRSFIKSISWRVLATSYIIVVSYFLTQKPFISLSLGIVDAILNIIEYYIHERIWDKIGFGR